MNRRPSTQDITWLIDLDRNGQLDLNPPYQRRSVWTRKDRQFFLDTIFRNYPSPAIFLHKTIDDGGKSTYHVVDGKQRTQTILDFVADKIAVRKDFGDARLDGKKWSQLEGETELKKSFWNYQITVEQIDITEGSVVNAVFDRLNRNVRKLTHQELRHSQFDGWLIQVAEVEASRDEWRAVGAATTARAKRMVDVQFLSELMCVVLEGKIMGFDQEALDDLYAKYEEPTDTLPEFSEDNFNTAFGAARTYLTAMVSQKAEVATYTKGFGHLYTLWSLIALTPPASLPLADELAARYVLFMERVDVLSAQEDLAAFLRDKGADGHYAHALTYLNNSRGASTDLTQRRERLTALTAELIPAAAQ